MSHDGTNRIIIGTVLRNDLAFRLDGVDLGTVPEPGSLALAGLALFGLLATRRKRTAVVAAEQTL